MQRILSTLRKAVEKYNLIDFNVDYGLVVHDVEKELNVSDILDFTLGAKSVLIENAIINLNSVSLSDLKHIDLTLNGVVVFKIDDALALGMDGVLFDNVDGNAQIYLTYSNENKLFTKFAYMDAGRVIITQERETDYVKILGDNTGRFLNDLRLAGKKEALLARLDSTQSVEDIYSTLNESVIFNADKLFYPIKNLTALNKNDFISSGIDAGGFALFGDDYYGYGLSANFAGRPSESVQLYLGGHIAMLDYQSDIDTYSAKQYAAEIGAKFESVSNIVFDISAGIGLLRVKTQQWKDLAKTEIKTVTSENVADVVSAWTGVPVSQLTEEESQKLLKLEEFLHKRIVGQEEAVNAVSKAVRRGRSFQSRKTWTLCL